MSPSKVLHAAQQIKESLLDVLFPKRCLSCGKTGVLCCAACLNTLPKSTLRARQRYAIFSYAHPAVKKLIWELKYRNVRPIAHVLAQKMYDEFTTQPAFNALKQKNLLIVPIPQTTKSNRERGFNQAAYLGRALAKHSEQFHFCPALIRAREGARQTDVGYLRARAENVKDAFTVAKPNLVAQRRVLVIDDITTTGATLAEAEKTLRAHGATQIFSLVVAH